MVEEGLGGDTDPAEPGGTGFTDGPPPVVELAQGTVDMVQEHRTVLVEPDTAPPPVEERGTQIGLQTRDGAAEGGLGDPQFLRGTADVLVAGDGLEVTQLQQVHDPPSLISREPAPDPAPGNRTWGRAGGPARRFSGYAAVSAKARSAVEVKSSAGSTVCQAPTWSR